MKNKIISLGVILLIFTSFLAPKILLEMEDVQAEKQIFTQSKTKTKIDVQAEKIYLVQAIHDMSESSMEIQSQTKIISDIESTFVEETYTKQEEKNLISQVKNELLKLEESKILKDMSASVDNTEYNFKNYTNLKKEYEMCYFFLGNKTTEMSVGIEGKTGKILFAVFPKNKLSTDLDKQEILENYVKYLDLYMIGDWKFENNSIQSEKAKLCAMLFLDANSDNCFLLIESSQNEVRKHEIVESTK